jgi:CrcB protein
MAKYLAVGAGGALGAIVRYYLGTTALGRFAAPFPTATFLINVTGSFILGFFLTLATEKVEINPAMRLAVAVGFVGAYTTFSTFEYETIRLIEDRRLATAILNIILSFTIGLLAVWGGILLARRLEGPTAMSELPSGTADHAFEPRADSRDPVQSEAPEREIRDASIG